MTQTKGLNFLLQAQSRKSLRTFILFAYFAIFQILILLQKPFVQLDFVIIFYGSFSLLFAHHFYLHYQKDYKPQALLNFFSYFFDFIIMIYFMKSFPQLSSFLLVLQLFMLFVASFELSFVSLCALGFLASVGTSVINLTNFQSGSVQNLLSLTLFNLSYVAVIVIAGQLKNDIYSMQIDLTQTRKKWKSQAEFSKTLIEKMPLGLIVAQANSHVIMQNSYLDKKIKLNFAQIKNLVSRQNNRGTSQLDYTYMSPGTEPKILEIENAEYFDEDVGEALSIYLLKDVTELRQLENDLKQKDKLATIGQLAAGIAHEIRNPLAGISGSIQLLSQDNDHVDPDQKKLMSIVLKEIDRLNDLITEFLDYAKPEKKPDQRINLKSLADEVIQVVKSHKEVSSTLRWDVHLTPQFVLGYSEKLKQALLNIIINAIQAVKSRPDPVILISLTNDEKNVILSVKDNGSGISPETQKRMFDPFHTTKPKGTGLGLAITHKILDAHQAQIIVNSEIDKGTEFKIKFPI
ncbi:MAG: GHKL domain-containing protein [Bdellovibrionaceae bacterium]|nr:GHKL domain-containing protein [Bdellovibrio sp.]